MYNIMLTTVSCNISRVSDNHLKDLVVCKEEQTKNFAVVRKLA